MTIHKLNNQKISVFILALFLFATSCKGSKKVADVPAKEESGILLQVNMEKGQSFRYKQDIKQQISQSIMGMENEMSQNIGFGFEMSVVDVIDGRPKVKVSYLSASYMMDNPMMQVDFDSEKSMENVPDAALGAAALIGLNFYGYVNKEGNLENMEGLEAFQEGLIENMRKLNPNVNEMMVAAMKEQYSAEKMQESFSGLSAFYPKTRVNVGDSWNQKMSIKTTFEMDLDTDYTLNKVEDGKAYLGVNSRLTTNPDTPLEVQGMLLSYAMEGDQTGETIVDLKTGMAISSTINQDINGIMTMEGGQIPEPTEVPMGIKSITTITLIK
ncbi:MAG: DUF6263 family protein [Bacteroidia bacterium]|nr:DUF6263 family protein [Bacteroidia bacterium]